MKTFADEKIIFAAEHIDCSYPSEHLPTRKPGTGMLTQYFSPDYDLANSFVIGDRITDVVLAKNLGARAFWLNDGRGLGVSEIKETRESLTPQIAVESRQWEDIYNYLKKIG
jgi:imidazoleglycerol-phosphate dehydratase/histidinol-phosphatase